MILAALRRAAIHACETTLMWRVAQPKRRLVPGVHEYDYEKPADAAVHVVFQTTINDVPVDMLTLEQALVAYPEWADLYSGQDPSVVWSLTPSYPAGSQQFNEGAFNAGSPYVLPTAILENASEPRCVTQIAPDKFIVLPLPDNLRAYELRMHYALKPKRTAAGMDDATFSELEEAILHGALRQLLAMQGVAWMDRELAQYHARAYATAVVERRARANLSNMRGSMTASAPSFV
jgi:hypothetical protein